MRDPRIVARLLGRPSVCVNGAEILHELPGKTRELFCYLVVFRAKQHVRETLASLLWSEHTPGHSRKYLRQSLWRLHETFAYRRVPDAGKIVTVDHEWVRFMESGLVWVDLVQLESASAVVSRPSDVRVSAPEFRQLSRVVPLYRGDLLEGCYTDWCSGERERVRQLYMRVLDTLMSRCQGRRNFGEGIAYGMRSLAVDDARESTYRAIMRLLYLSGDRTSALRLYDRCAAAIWNEFGVQPEAETDRLVREIKTGRDSGRPTGIGRAPTGPELGSRRGIEKVLPRAAGLYARKRKPRGA